MRPLFSVHRNFNCGGTTSKEHDHVETKSTYAIWERHPETKKILQIEMIGRQRTYPGKGLRKPASYNERLRFFYRNEIRSPKLLINFPV
jgi:hypothetical protein